MEVQITEKRKKLVLARIEYLDAAQRLWGFLSFFQPKNIRQPRQASTKFRDRQGRLFNILHPLA